MPVHIVSERCSSRVTSCMCENSESTVVNASSASNVLVPVDRWGQPLILAPIEISSTSKSCTIPLRPQKHLAVRGSLVLVVTECSSVPLVQPMGITCAVYACDWGCNVRMTHNVNRIIPITPRLILRDRPEVQFWGCLEHEALRGADPGAVLAPATGLVSIVQQGVKAVPSIIKQVRLKNPRCSIDCIAVGGVERRAFPMASVAKRINANSITEAIASTIRPLSPERSAI